MKNISKIMRALEKQYGKTCSEITKSGNKKVFGLLIHTVLAARNTDKNADAAAKELFSRYNTPGQIASAPLPDIRKRIKRGVFFNVKAKNIKKLCSILSKKYSSKVPDTMSELVALPGVGRKTANIVLTYGFGKTEGIAVDTHVFRTTNRIGIVNEKTPEKTEKTLLKVVPRKYWQDFNHMFVLHGREICKARKPLCNRCVLKNQCDYYSRKV